MAQIKSLDRQRSLLKKILRRMKNSLLIDKQVYHTLDIGPRLGGPYTYRLKNCHKSTLMILRDQ